MNVKAFWKKYGMEERMKEKKGSFSGSIGFVLAAAGSAVGVGNIWRFPYLCAKDGGGLFLIIYLVLVLTFGFVLLTNEPMTSPAPAMTLIPWLSANFSASGTSPVLTAITIAVMPRIAISGTEI